MKISYQKNLDHWINFWVFIFCLSVIAFKGHGGQAAIILILTMGYVFFSKELNWSKYKLSNDEKTFLIIILLFWILNIINSIYQPQGLEYESSRIALRSIDNPMRWILMLPLFFLFRRFKLDWRWISVGLSIGALFSVIVAAHEVYFLGANRAKSTMNHEITYGQIMVIVDIFLWIFMIFAWKKNKKIIAIILFVASLIAFYGSLLSITRGAWLVYIFLIIFFIAYTLRKGLSNWKYLFSKPILLRVFFAFIIFFMVSQTSHYKSIEERTLVVFNNASQGEFHKAAGGRVPLWKTAIKIAKYYPFGVGTDNYRNGGKAIIINEAKNNKKLIIKDNNSEILNHDDLFGNVNNFGYLQSFYEDGTLQYTSRWRHAHNEWLNVLAENGILGFILLTLIFIFPLRIFWKNLKNKNELVSTYSFSGILLIFSFAIFGQTQSVFTSHAALIFFIFFLYLFIGQIYRLTKLD